MPFLEENVHADILRGAAEIAAFLFGKRTDRRKVYHLSEHAGLPVFRLGSTLCARRSTLLRWIQDQEGEWIGRPTAEDLRAGSGNLDSGLSGVSA